MQEIDNILGDGSSGVLPGLSYRSQGVSRWRGGEEGPIFRGWVQDWEKTEWTRICWSCRCHNLFFFCREAGRKGSNCMLRDGWRVGVYVHVWAPVEGGGRGEGKVLKKRRKGALQERSESSDVSIELLNTDTSTPFDVLLSSSAPNESK